MWSVQLWRGARGRRSNSWALANLPRFASETDFRSHTDIRLRGDSENLPVVCLHLSLRLSWVTSTGPCVYRPSEVDPGYKKSVRTSQEAPRISISKRNWVHTAQNESRRGVRACVRARERACEPQALARSHLMKAKLSRCV